ncbi:hypothetical protein [Dactylosporangium sp. AC04546]|uniref:hypothetical protein n=1 Tax=Dactylosporangium sp. AC04546 TaxID=2862460 RepID=UPI003FA4B68D
MENSEFDAFARRILRAYARRVAAGDVEALKGLSSLTAELDAVVREAVRGLRQPPYRYSWDEIGQRLGVSRQAVQMRYGDKAERSGSTLDTRITKAGMAVSVATLVEVFAHHFPGIPAPQSCPGCDYSYPTDPGVSAECPSLATVRPLLHARRYEDEHAMERLTSDHLDYLRNPKAARFRRRHAVKQVAHQAPAPDREQSLLDLVEGN